MSTDNTTPPASNEKPSNTVGSTGLTDTQIKALSTERGTEWVEAREIAATGGVMVGEKFKPVSTTPKTR